MITMRNNKGILKKNLELFGFIASGTSTSVAVIRGKQINGDAFFTRMHHW